MSSKHRRVIGVAFLTAIVLISTFTVMSVLNEQPTFQVDAAWFHQSGNRSVLDVLLFYNDGQTASSGKQITLNISESSNTNSSYYGPSKKIAMLNSSTNSHGIVTFSVNKTLSLGISKYQYGWELLYHGSTSYFNFRDVSNPSTNSSQCAYFMNSILDNSNQGHNGASLLVSYLSLNNSMSGSTAVYYQYYDGSSFGGNYSQTWNYLGTFSNFTTVKVSLNSVPSGENLYNIKVVSPVGNFTHWYSTKPIS
jgi:hypothetical protein